MSHCGKEENRGGPRGGRHAPVLLREVVEHLALAPGDSVADGTVGLGGHAFALASVIVPSGRLFAFDRDAAALAMARERLAPTGVEAHFCHAPFSEMTERLRADGAPLLNGVLLDLGVSSYQIDTPERGFSFRHDAPLDMRMSPESGAPTAADLLARLSREEIADILWQYGEERFSRRIAKSLVEQRADKPIQTTGALADLVRRCIPGRARIDKATRTFQALRIAVNDELGELERALDTIPELLAPGGRLAIISFHSLEDRRVKVSFRDRQADGDFRVVTRKPLKADEAEQAENPRSRSAKLRVLERI